MLPLPEPCFLNVNNEILKLNKNLLSLIIKDLVGKNGLPKSETKLLKLLNPSTFQLENFKTPQTILENATTFKISPFKNYEIDEENKTALRIKLGKTTYEQVENMLGHPDEINPNKLYYKKTGLNIYFNENNQVEEIIFSSPYPGKTKKGLRIGDTIDKAYKLYGTPRISTVKSDFWLSMAIFNKNRIITEIKLF